MSKRESELLIGPISRRKFLKLGALLGGSLLLPGCLSPETPQSPTPESPEIIRTELPGIIVERHTVDFQEITSQVPISYLEDVKKWLRESDFYFHLAGTEESPRGRQILVYNGFGTIASCGLSFVDINVVRPDHKPELFYVDGNNDRVYADVVHDGDFSFGKVMISEEDRRILNRQYGAVRPESIDMSCDGKILYRVSHPGIGGQKDPEVPAVLADISNGTKTFIKGLGRRDITELTDDGNKLLLTLHANPDDTEIPGETFLINLNNWQVEFRLNEPSLRAVPLLNEDGSFLYLASEDPRIAYVYNIATGEKTPVRWRGLGVYATPPIASPNLRFIARSDDLPSKAIIYTPEGVFRISRIRASVEEGGLYPLQIDNEGTLSTYSALFEFKDGTYELAATRNGEPLEVHIAKIYPAFWD